MNRRQLKLAVAIILGALALVPAVALAQDGRDQEGLLLRIGGTTVVQTDERIGFVAVIDGDLDIAGEVSEFLAVVNADAQVLNGGRVDGDVAVLDGVLTLRDGSDVQGDILLSEDAELVIETGANHRGDVQHDAFEWNPGREFVVDTAVFYLSYWLLLTLVLLVFASAFAGVGGRQLSQVASDVTERIAGTLIATALILGIVFLLSCVLFFSIIGIPLIFLLLLGGSIAWYLGLIVAGTRIGALILRRPLTTPERDRPYLQAVVGTLILQLFSLIAGAGWLFLFVFGVIAGGSMLLTLLVGVPATVIAVLVAVAGMLGFGALTYRGALIWSRRAPSVHHEYEHH